MINKFLIFVIKIYQYAISPFLPPSCRFYPSCSEYGLQALKKYNWLKAIPMIAWRILRCNPFNKGGYDPVK